MAEENQAQQGPTGPVVPTEPQQVQQEPQQVTTKDPKKVEVGKRLAAINHKKREVKKRKEQVQLEKTTSRVNQYYGIGAIITVGMIGGCGYYIYRSKKGQVSRDVKDVSMPHNPPKPHPQASKV